MILTRLTRATDKGQTYISTTKGDAALTMKHGVTIAETGSDEVAAVLVRRHGFEHQPEGASVEDAVFVDDVPEAAEPAGVLADLDDAPPLNLPALSVKGLRALAKDRGLKGYSKLNRDALVDLLAEAP